MSSDFDQETLQMYIEESKEHLDSIESDLLIIEKNGADIDSELVNRVFRAAHSIKGGAGFLGLDTIKELAHKIENVLDLVRNDALVPTPPVVHILLTAFDRLGTLIDDATNSNGQEIAGEIDALTRIISGGLGQDEMGLVEAASSICDISQGVCFETSALSLTLARAGGKNIYILEYDLINDVQLKGKTPRDLIKALEETGEVLEAKIGLAKVGDLNTESAAVYIPISILYASIIEEDLLGVVLEINAEQIKPVSRETEESLRELRLIHKEETAQAQVSASSPVKPPLTATPDLPIPADPVRPTMTAKPTPPPISKAAAPARPEPVIMAKKMAAPSKPTPKSDSLRVQVAILDQLMNRAGELVLARNALLQALNGDNQKAIQAAGQKINQVTSDLQESIMRTRMQAVGNIFSKFPRVVRDLARDLDKEMELILEGEEVELDKSLIEGLGDPLTHLVRNSCDHGIEAPEERKARGKKAGGTIFLRAFHESGQVIIEIEDDGRGLDPERIADKAISKGMVTAEQTAQMSDREKAALIMLPGFSMAEQVTEVSGRGVGMDVVKTNLDQLGGQVELISEVGKGTTVRIKLPLTLAIIPSLLVSACKERFALPQVNVCELMRIPAAEVRQKIEKIGEADVLILRGELLPLLKLGNALLLEQSYYDQKIGQFRLDRRGSLSDLRLAEAVTVPDSDIAMEAERAARERRDRRESDITIVVLQTGAFRFGLVVDMVHDTVEIVVKPLGQHLSDLKVYAGATIMGDGHVALILDVAGLAGHAELQGISEAAQAAEKVNSQRAEGFNRQSLLLFQNGPDEFCAVPLHLVLRVEQIKTADIEVKGGKKVIQYRGGTLPIFALEEVTQVSMLEEREQLAVILFVIAGHEVGLLAVPPLDILEDDLVEDEVTLRQPGIRGSAIIHGRTTLLIDIIDVFRTLNPEWFAALPAPETRLAREGVRPVVVVEDSMFFRTQIRDLLTGQGYAVRDFEDGSQAWEFLEANPDGAGLVVTDLEMPRMDGFELTRRIKADDRLKHLTVIGLSALASETDLEKGKKAGIDQYQIKLDKELLLQAVSDHVR